MADLKCPECKCITSMGIPKNKCMPFFKCSKCDKMINAKDSCCVFCDYSDVKCSVSHLKI
jgi:hypothetical protein